MAGWAASLHATVTRAAEPGLGVQFTALDGGTAKAVDTTVLPNVWLYVRAGQSPTPFLPGGRFSAVWSGTVSVDLRAEFSFQAELSGDLKLEINGQPVLEATSNGGQPAISKPVKLNKGANALTATFRSPAEGDAFLRLAWSNRETPSGPIPLMALAHADSPELQQGNQLRLGRELLVEYRCLKCHAQAAPNADLPELVMDAPSFEGIGARRNVSWMADWILDPRSRRASAHMPKMFRGANSKADSEAAAAYLGSLKSEADKLVPGPETTGEQREAGQKLFDALHCVACHQTPGTKEADENKISLHHVREKFPAGALASFLIKPDAHFAWT